ncbi:Transmembrane ascorbate ferrireductase 1 [Zea mays]|uniref:Transmembrane ascorbate ferrireductase 1 n=1 Tax=Zea mays TaxID=4577 RepID=A0A1D6KRA9_MAIZE|nr:Transmembrane ascorbate ferrireductase 1 [Zea mays]
MAVPAPAKAARLLAASAAVLVLLWCVHFRGGLSFGSPTNKGLIFNWLFGVATFFFPGASPTVRRRMLPWHTRAGLVVYILALLASELGFLEKLTFLQAAGLGRYSSEALLVNFTALVILLLGASVVLYVTAPMHNEHAHGYSAVHKP